VIEPGSYRCSRSTGVVTQEKRFSLESNDSLGTIFCKYSIKVKHAMKIVLDDSLYLTWNYVDVVTINIILLDSILNISFYCKDTGIHRKRTDDAAAGYRHCPPLFIIPMRLRFMVLLWPRTKQTLRFRPVFCVGLVFVLDNIPHSDTFSGQRELDSINDIWVWLFRLRIKMFVL